MLLVDGRERHCRQTAGLDVPEDYFGSAVLNTEYHTAPRVLIKPAVPWSPVREWSSLSCLQLGPQREKTERRPTVRCLQHHSFAIGPHPGGVVGLDSGVVGTVEV